MAQSLGIVRTLKIEDLFEVYEILKDASPKWFNLGLALGLKMPTLTNLESKYTDNDTRLCRMLAKVLESRNVTWTDLADALRSPTVELGPLADLILREKEKSTGGTRVTRGTTGTKRKDHHGETSSSNHASNKPLPQARSGFAAIGMVLAAVLGAYGLHQATKDDDSEDDSDSYSRPKRHRPN